MGKFRLSSRMRWSETDTAILESMMDDEADTAEIAAAFPDRTAKAIKMHMRFIRKGKPSRARTDGGYIPTETELKRIEEHRPILDALTQWGHITRKGQLVPMIRAEIAEAA